MESPRIQYATTVDGISIAHCSIGSGLPVIHIPPIPWAHLQIEWDHLAYRAWFERFAQVANVVRYDPRGTGLSDREVGEITMENLLKDIDAVADRLALDKFALMGVTPSGPLALVYAATRPDRVSHLLLWCTAARGEDLSSPDLLALEPLAETNFELFTETVAHSMVAGWGASDDARFFARLMREATTSDCMQRYACLHRDAAEHLPDIKAPTLILHRREVRFPSIQAARRLAAEIRNAELALLEGNALLPEVGDVDAAHQAIESFLGLPASEPALPHAAAHHHEHEAHGLFTILFTDVEAHTEMMARLGDERGRAVLREHERLTRTALREHGGTEIKNMGDGFMASFISARRALECAIALQRAFDDYNHQHPDARLDVRVGLNAGEPIAEKDDLFGSAVIMASRIAAKAEGGQVLVANVVRELVAGKGFAFADRGESVLRGFEDAVRLYELHWRL